jgi:hypothetical protein
MISAAHQERLIRHPKERLGAPAESPATDRI